MALNLKRVVPNTDYMIGAAVMLFFAAVGMYVATLFPSALRNSSVKYTILEQDTFSVTCPGDLHRFMVEVNIIEPSIIEVTTVFVDAKTQQVMPVENPFYLTRTRVYSRSSAYVQPITWIVPNVPPGDYLRVTAAISKYVNSKPTMIEIPFTVAENCE